MSRRDRDATDARVGLHWSCEAPSHYNDVLFRALHDAGFARLRVHYRRDSLPSHPWRTPLRTGYDSRVQRRVLGVDWFLLKCALLEPGAQFVLGGWADATSLLLIGLCILSGRRYVVWSDTPKPDDNRKRAFAAARNAVLRVVLGRAHRILGTGVAATEALVRMGAAWDKVVDFPYWTDIGALDPRSRRPDFGSGPTVRFVSAGRVDNALKGHDLAIRSLAEALRLLPAAQVEYLIAGTGPDVAFDRALAESLGIGDRLEMPGWVEPDALADLLLGADVLIHPSPVLEPYGVAVIEAMAAGMIVLASDATCAGLDRIEHGVNGFIHPAGDVDALSEQIRWLLTHPEAMPGIRRAARRTAEQWPVSRGVGIIRAIVGTADGRKAA
jgi:glycosyltransferase involved in cell wall biosynthesis